MFTLITETLNTQNEAKKAAINLEKYSEFVESIEQSDGYNVEADIKDVENLIECLKELDAMDIFCKVIGDY